MKRDITSQQASLLVVAVGDYDDTQAYQKLEHAPQAAKNLAQALAPSRNLESTSRIRPNGIYRHEYPQLLNGGRKDGISSLVRQWFQAAQEDDVLFFFWTGHGKSEAEGHYLITKESPSKDLDGAVAFSATTLGAMVAKSPADKILVVLDTCYSGAGAADVANTLARVLATRVPKAGRSRAVTVIASAHPLKRAQEGRLCEPSPKF